MAECCESHRLCLADSELRHRSHPNRNRMLLADLINSERRTKAPDSLNLDIRDLHAAQTDRATHILLGFEAFIQTHRRPYLALQFGKLLQHRTWKRLLEHHQPELVEGLEHF